MRYKSYALVVMGLFIIPNLYYVCIGRESFPFTQAPMFGHHIGDETRFFSFKFILEEDSTEMEISPEFNTKMPLAEISGNRFFFNVIYGSVEETSPFGYYKNDTPAALENRMDLFFDAFFKPYLQKKNARIRVDILQYNRQYKLNEKHTLGYFDIGANHFRHTWKHKI